MAATPGQEGDASPGRLRRDIADVIAGRQSCDEIGKPKQVVVRVAWLEHIAADLASLDLRSRFDLEGRTRWSEADDLGNVTVFRRPDGEASPPPD